MYTKRVKRKKKFSFLFSVERVGRCCFALERMTHFVECTKNNILYVLQTLGIAVLGCCECFIANTMHGMR